MKKLLLIVILIFGIASCQKKQDKEMNANNSIEELIYSIEVQSASPYKLFLNDIEIDRNFESGSVNYSMDINQWILESSKIEIRVELFPQKSSTDNLISKKISDYFEVNLFKREKSNDFSQKKLIANNKITNFNQPTSKITQTWLNDIIVPYKIKGWSEAVNLTKIPKEKLTERVLAIYKEVFSSINEGNVEKYNNFFKKADEEFYLSNYYTTSEINEENSNISSLIHESKGKTTFSNDYKLIFYNNGRLVSLEDSNGKSPIKADLDEETQFYSIMLMLSSSDSNAPLEIIR